MSCQDADTMHHGGRSKKEPSQLDLLTGALRRAKGFCLYYVQCSSSYYKKRGVEFIRTMVDKPIVEVELQLHTARSIDSQIENAVKNESPDALIFLHGIEKLFTVISHDESFKRMQEINIRRSFYARMERPLAIWAPDFALTLFVRGVPDFHDWYSGIYIVEPPVQRVALSGENRIDFLFHEPYGFQTETPGPMHGRSLTMDDRRLFKRWVDLYLRQLHNQKNARRAFLDLGREMYRWLGGGDGIMENLAFSVHPPLILEFSITGNPSSDQLLFLDVPWELLADEDGHLAANPRVKFCPVRRIGERKMRKKASEHRLKAIFMAAAPSGSGVSRNYEAEEAAIINSAREVGMELTVEESGSLPMLAECMKREWPVDILHISCACHREPKPVLFLENEEGNPSMVDAEAFIESLDRFQTRILFLSANGAEAPEHFPTSILSTFVQSGFSAVLGWGGPASDSGAIRFTRMFHDNLQKRRSIETSVALARYALLNPSDSTEFQPFSDWHMARLFLGPGGGGVVCTGQKPPRKKEQDAPRTFLDFTGRRIPVVGKNEFVGRRRPIQKILKAFRENFHAGVLIHGFGQIGKSSLAARIVDHLVDLKPVVIFDRYDAFTILDRIYATIETPGILDIIRRFREKPESFPSLFKELLENSCRGAVEDPEDKRSRQAIMLIIDDFEQALDDPTGKSGPHRVKDEFSDTYRSIIQAFSRVSTESRLLFTSRYGFTFPCKGRDLVDELFFLHLPPMDKYESKKQAAAKRKYTSGEDRPYIDPSRIERCIKTARGNPGLQDLLFSISLQAPDRFDKALEEMDAYIEIGRSVGEEKLREFLENLAVDGLRDLLSSTERDLLKASTLFRIPVPVKSYAVLGLGDGERLLALGFWDAYKDFLNPDSTAAALNPLARPKAGNLSEKKQRSLAQMLLKDLFTQWGGEDGVSRPFDVDHELARLGLLANDARVLTVVALSAVAGLEERFMYREAADMAVKTIGILEDCGIQVPRSLFLKAGHVCHLVGNMEKARLYVESAIRSLRSGDSESRSGFDSDLGSALLLQGRLFVQSGAPRKARRIFEEARDLFQLANNLERQAVATGEIAKILANTGSVEESLSLHRERLRVFEELGDRREKAVTLGDIARIRVSRGEEDEALSLHWERLRVFEELGDLDGKANSLWSIAQIELRRGLFREAFEHLSESYYINLKLGRLDGICLVGSALGILLCQAGQTEQGIELLTRSKEGFIKLGQEAMAEQVEEMMQNLE